MLCFFLGKTVQFSQAMLLLDVLFHLSYCAKASLTPSICVQLSLLLLQTITASIAACPDSSLTGDDIYFRVKKYRILASLFSKGVKHSKSVESS